VRVSRKNIKRTAGENPAASATSPGEAQWLTPLAHILQVMRDPATEPQRRDEMAKLALPYLHPKAAPVDDPGSAEDAIETLDISDTDLARRIGFILARAALGKS